MIEDVRYGCQTVSNTYDTETEKTVSHDLKTLLGVIVFQDWLVAGSDGSKIVATLGHVVGTCFHSCQKEDS